MWRPVHPGGVTILAALLLSGAGTHRAYSEARSPTLWALVVDIGEYADPAFHPLPATSNDGDAIEALYRKSEPNSRVCGRIEVRRLSAAPGRKEQGRPTRRNLLELFDHPEHGLVQAVGKGDTVLLFFSGHGMTQVGEQWLIPNDAQFDRPENTWLRLDDLHSRLRQIEERSAKTVLFLDSCRNELLRPPDTVRSATKVPQKRGPDVVTGQMTDSFFDKILTLSRGRAVYSSARRGEFAKEASFNGHPRGVFSYYLEKGLLGEADADHNGIVTLPEVQQYVDPRVVQWIAGNSQSSPQTPSLSMIDVSGLIPLSVVKPASEGKESPPSAADAEEAIARLIESLLPALRPPLETVAVVEFWNDSAAEEVLGGDTGAVGRFVADALAQRVQQKLQGKPLILPPEASAPLLAKARFNLADLRGPETINGQALSRALLERGIAVKARPGTDAVHAALLGGSISRHGGFMAIAARLMAVPGGNILASATATLPLDADLASLSGESAYIPPGVDGQRSEEAHKKILEASQLPPEKKEHPMADPFSGLPYKMELVVDGRSLPVRYQNGQAFIQAQARKPYAIQIINQSDRAVAVSVLIDGLSSVGQKRELPSEARKWVIRAGKRLTLSGWQMDEKKAREFVFVKASESLSARKGFTDQIGLITAAFYPEKKPGEQGDQLRTGTIGTGEGKEIESGVEVVQMDYFKTPAAILSLRYGSEED